MNPNYFYDINYRSGVVCFEYSRREPDEVAWSAFYDDGMLSSPLLNDEGRMWVQRYQTVPRFDSDLRAIGLEFDCESQVPALFVNLHPAGTGAQDTLNALADIQNLPRVSLPVLCNNVFAEEVGIFPSRYAGVYRFQVRGTAENLRAFADAHGCVNTDIITSTSHYPPRTTSLNFDWDGTTISHVAYASPNIYTDDPWVIEKTEEARAKIAVNYADTEYFVHTGVKCALWPDAAPDYLKLYVAVRLQR
jgi:hypothetical protein